MDGVVGDVFVAGGDVVVDIGDFVDVVVDIGFAVVDVVLVVAMHVQTTILDLRNIINDDILIRL